MAAGSIKIDGLDKLVKNLKKLHPEIANGLKQINRDLADELVPVARSAAPRRSGRLADSVRSGSTATTGIVRAGGAKVPYAKVIHFGWPKHNIKPQPFLYDALDSRRGEIVDKYVERVTKIVDGVME